MTSCGFTVGCVPNHLVGGSSLSVNMITQQITTDVTQKSCLLRPQLVFTVEFLLFS